MLATIHDDIWNVLNMQHVTPDSKRWNYSDIPGGGHKKIKGLTCAQIAQYVLLNIKVLVETFIQFFGVFLFDAKWI